MTSEATNGHHVPPIASASAPAVVENTELNRDVVQWGILTNAGMIILPFQFSQLELEEAGAAGPAACLRVFA